MKLPIVKWEIPEKKFMRVDEPGTTSFHVDELPFLTTWLSTEEFRVFHILAIDAFLEQPISIDVILSKASEMTFEDYHIIQTKLERRDWLEVVRDPDNPQIIIKNKYIDELWDKWEAKYGSV